MKHHHGSMLGSSYSFQVLRNEVILQRSPPGLHLLQGPAVWSSKHKPVSNIYNSQKKKILLKERANIQSELYGASALMSAI